MEKGMWNWIKIVRNNTLLKWILVGCIVLMIPLISAIINFFINRNLLEQKIEQVNRFMVKNIQYGIDAKLEDIQNAAKQYQMDEKFSNYQLKVADESDFLRQVQICQEELELLRRVNSDMEIMIYLPQKDYILSSKTANTVENVYDSLMYRNQIQMSIEDWRDYLSRTTKGEVLIADQMSYSNAGVESLVYIIPILYSTQEDGGWIFCSVPTTFIDQMAESEGNMGSTILILDKNSNVIGQYGKIIDLEETSWNLDKEGSQVLLGVGKENYIGAYCSSDVTDWTYMVCTPEQIYMKEVVSNRNINFLIVFCGAAFGILAVILMEKRNYRPIKKLMNILPEREECDSDEFALVEKNLRKLFHENSFMQNMMEARREYDRELSLLSVIKGRGNDFGKLTPEELLGKDHNYRAFCFSVVNTDMEERNQGNEMSMDYDLFQFLVENVIMDTFDNVCCFLKTMDDGTLVYLFMRKEEEDQCGWKHQVIRKFEWIHEFFQNRLEIDLPITIGKEFESFNYVESAYAEMQEINEQRSYIRPEGIVDAEEFNQVDVTSLQRIQFFSKQFEIVALEADYSKAKEIAEAFFRELKGADASFHHTVYCSLAIVNTILLFSRNILPDQMKMIEQKDMEETLARLRYAESISVLKEEFYFFLKLICRAVDEENRDQIQLSEKVKRYVKEHYQDCNVNISTIAEKIGITPRYMSKLFYDQTGIHLLSYINDVRIEHAKLLLRTTEKTVDEIAEETGFANTRTFRRNFQKATGATAREYKKN